MPHRAGARAPQAWPSRNGRSCLARLLATVLLWLASLLAVGASAQELLPVPALSAHVIDTTGTLGAEEKSALEAKLADFELRKGSQIVLLMVATTQPEDIASYANRVGNAWKIGRRDVGDGVLLIVAKNDRKVRIEVAKALEGAIPDLAARHIIDQAITPSFREGKYAAGLDAAADQLMARISGEALPEPGQASDGARQHAGGLAWGNMLAFMVFALPMGAVVARSIFGRKLGAVATGLGVGGLAWVVSASAVIAVIAALVALVYAVVTGFSSFGGGRGFGRGGLGGLGAGVGMGGWGAGRGGGGGFGGGGFGGGGFSSGGGGDFGGGGASGSW